MFNYINSDLYRLTGRCNSVYDFIKMYLRNSTFRFQVALRLRQSRRTRILGNLLWILNSNRKWIKIHPETKIGYGLYIGHGGPIVVHPSTIIGNNVNLSQFTTIGTNSGKSAVIGNNVYIGPNTCIIDNINIGNDVTIGAGSVVTKDIPDNATACGNYAKVINFKEPGRFIGNKWE